MTPIIGMETIAALGLVILTYTAGFWSGYLVKKLSSYKRKAPA